MPVIQTQEVIKKNLKTVLEITRKFYEASSRAFLPYKGLFLSSMSGIFFSLSAVIVGSLKEIHPGQLAVHRFFGILLISLPPTIFCKRSIFGNRKERKIMMLRGLVGSTNLYLNFLAFRYLPIGEASVIIFSLPVFVSILGRIFLNEQCDLFQVLAVILTLIGLAMISGFPFVFFDYSNGIDHQRMVGLVSAFVSLVLGSNVFIILRKMKDMDKITVLFNFACFGVVETALITALTGNFVLPSCGDQWWISVLGVLSFLGQLLITLATSCENASATSTVRSATDIALAFVWQILFFQKLPNKLSITGALLVTFSVVLLSIQKFRRN